MNSHRHDWATARTRIQARMAELRLDPVDLARASGLSEKHVRTLLSVDNGGAIPRDKTRWRLCDALRWTPDSIDRILDGQEPVEVTDDSGEVSRYDLLDDRLRLLEQAMELLQESFEVALQAGMAKSADLRERVSRLEQGVRGGGDQPTP